MTTATARSRKKQVSGILLYDHGVVHEQPPGVALFCCGYINSLAPGRFEQNFR